MLMCECPWFASVGRTEALLSQGKFGKFGQGNELLQQLRQTAALEAQRGQRQHRIRIRRHDSDPCCPQAVASVVATPCLLW